MSSKPRRSSRPRKEVKFPPSFRPHHTSYNKEAVPGPAPPPRPPRVSLRKRPSPKPQPPYEATTDPSLVDRPVPEHVDSALSRAWKIEPKHPMCLIFDVISPVRRFKRDSVYVEKLNERSADHDEERPTELVDEASFADYDDPDLSDTDAVPSRMPAYPVPYRCVPFIPYIRHYRFD